MLIAEDAVGLVLLTVVSADSHASRLISNHVLRSPFVSSHLIDLHPWALAGAWAEMRSSSEDL